MPVVEWKQTAREDLLEIVDYISDDNLDAALCLVESIEAKANALSTHPKMYRKGRVPDTREAPIHPHYILVYMEHPEKVTILRVLHTAQRWPETTE